MLLQLNTSKAVNRTMKASGECLNPLQDYTCLKSKYSGFITSSNSATAARKTAVNATQCF